ncbi:MAG: DUF4153 domain-containing protein [Robiginitomaculum sp.]|nr:DUF4153 domain-containing protein [Robiginitomaculum sp.]
MSKLKQWFESVVPDAQAVFRRFPLAIVLAAALTGVILTETSFGGLSNEMLMRLIGGIVLAAYVSVILTLYGEGRGKAVSLAGKVAAVLTSLLAGYFFRQMAFITPAAIGASILFLGNAPFWRQNRDDVAVWDFTHKLWTAVLFTVAGSLIYVIGIFAITSALRSLFGVDMRDLVEDWMMPIGLAFLAPMAWLSMLPRHDEEDADSLRNPGFISKAVGFLGAWILAPLTLIYAVILLAYGIKIVLTQSVPDGEIAALVTPFLIIGALTWLILDPPFIQKKRLARWYTKLWFPLSIPAALLLTYAVFVRIGQYGWTIERYLLVLAAVWALGIACWFIFRGEAKRDIRIIPGFAALLLALGSIGPWGADGVSSMSQSGRLKSALVANQMLDGDGFLKPVSELNLEDKDQAMRAKGTLNYLIKHRKRNKILQFVPDSEKTDVFDNMAKDDSWEHSYVNKRFGLDKVRSQTRNWNNTRYAYSGQKEPISVMGYEYISSRQSHVISRNKNSSQTKNYALGNYKIESTNDAIKLYDTGNKVVAEFDIWTWVRDQPVNAKKNTILLKPRRVLYENGATKIALHIGFANYDKSSDYSRVTYVILTKGVDID